MKVIFLDIDGVLNGDKLYDLFPEEVYLVDDNSLKRLAKLVELTNAKIVLSSSWSLCFEYTNNNEVVPVSHGGYYLMSKLKSVGLFIHDIFDKSYVINRDKFIYNYITKHQIDNFVILDDELFNYEKYGLLDKLVYTTFGDESTSYEEEGFSESKFNEALSILKGK